MSTLIAQGYLAPLRGILTAANMPTEGVHVARGEFISRELSDKACEPPVVEAAADELVFLGANRQSWIVFCIDVAHSRAMAEALTARGIMCGVVTGKTPNDERARIIADAKQGRLRALVNCETLTTGLDVPRIDLIGLLRPTMSKGLLIQQIGRGARLSPETEKEDCVVCDLSENLTRHKPLDGLPETRVMRTPAREESDEKKRKAAAPRQALTDWRHERRASLEDPFAEAAGAETLPVTGMTYEAVYSRTRGLHNLVATYLCTTGPGVSRVIKQWICIEHPSTGGRGGRWHAERWWQRRTAQNCPRSASDAVGMLHHMPQPLTIAVRMEQGYLRVIGEQFPESTAEIVPPTLSDAPGCVDVPDVADDTSEQLRLIPAPPTPEFATAPVGVILEYLSEHGVTLVPGGPTGMLWRGPKSLATPEVLGALASRKAELRKFIN
jgi:DNA repair protein RadD